jgi:hypothetical protein
MRPVDGIFGEVYETVWGFVTRVQERGRRRSTALMSTSARHPTQQSGIRITQLLLNCRVVGRRWWGRPQLVFVQAVSSQAGIVTALRPELLRGLCGLAHPECSVSRNSQGLSTA